MKPQLLPATRYSKSETLQIKKKLDDFYCTVGDYSAFVTPSDQVHCWEHIAIRLRELIKFKQKVRVLEVGAGKSGFGTYLVREGLRHHCIWIAQDVTHQNSAWLTENADGFAFGDVDSTLMPEQFDIVFSTFVLEHVVDPNAHLEQLARLLNRQYGTLFIFCPRYDFPGYLPPSSRHLSRRVQLGFAVSSCFARLKTMFTGIPAFLVQNDLAAFHLPFFTDADAVHWASSVDLKKWAQKKGAYFLQLKIGKPRRFSKEWIVKRLLTAAVSIQFDGRTQ
jgi:SAM-dependent methyltransferase